MAQSYGYLKIVVLMLLYANICFKILKITFMVIAHASRPSKQFALKPSIDSAFLWHTRKLSSLILWNARVTVSRSWFCLERVHPVTRSTV